MSRIKILIVDDHAIVHEGLRALIESDDRLETVAEAYNGKEALELFEQFNPDVILMDLVMPVMTGIETIRRIKESKEEARILVLTSYADDEKVFSAIKAGAAGYILKDSKPDEILNAIITIFNGSSSLHPSIAAKVMRELTNPNADLKDENNLTDREIEVLRLVAQGFSNLDISVKLNITENTVSSHISNIMHKLHLANRTQAALYALRKGLARLD